MYGIHTNIRVKIHTYKEEKEIEKSINKHRCMQVYTHTQTQILRLWCIFREEYESMYI